MDGERRPQPELRARLSPRSVADAAETGRAPWRSAGTTVPRATDMSCDFASMAGPTAAIALPPQMAVPTLTSVEVSRGVPQKPPENRSRSRGSARCRRRCSRSPPRRRARRRSDSSPRRGPRPSRAEASPSPFLCSPGCGLPSVTASRDTGEQGEPGGHPRDEAEPESSSRGTASSSRAWSRPGSFGGGGASSRW